MSGVSLVTLYSKGICQNPDKRSRIEKAISDLGERVDAERVFQARKEKVNGLGYFIQLSVIGKAVGTVFLFH